jgi:uncharacterized protein (TIGR02444 family)
MSDAGKISLAGPHWTFALELYAKPQIAPACLTLQDQAGVDVIVLLFSLHLLQRDGIALETPQLASLDLVVRPWREGVVVPLRSIRRRIKQGVAGVATHTAGTLLREIGQAEISSEQIALAMLAALPIGAGHGDKSGDVGSLIERVVQFYSPSWASSLGYGEVRAAIKTIIEGAAANS